MPCDIFLQVETDGTNMALQGATGASAHEAPPPTQAGLRAPPDSFNGLRAAAGAVGGNVPGNELGGEGLKRETEGAKDHLLPPPVVNTVVAFPT